MSDTKAITLYYPKIKREKKKVILEIPKETSEESRIKITKNLLDNLVKFLELKNEIEEESTEEEYKDMYWDALYTKEEKIIKEFQNNLLDFCRLVGSERLL